IARERDRQPMLEIPCREAPLARIVAQRDLALRQCLPIGGAENRNENAGSRAMQGRPIDVERARMRRCGPPFERAEPPRVVGAMHANVVGHEIDDESETCGPQRGRQLGKSLVAAELWIEPCRIDHVVAVGAASPRLEDRRRIDMAHAEIAQIGDDPCRSSETEIRRQLQAVGRDHRGPDPALQNTDQGGSGAGAGPPEMGWSWVRAWGRAAAAPDRLASKARRWPDGCVQCAVTTFPAARVASGAKAILASSGTILARRTARRSRTRARRAASSARPGASQSSTAERNVASASGSGISSPNRA